MPDFHPSLLTTPVRQLLRRTPLSLPPDSTIAQAAQRMCEGRASSVLIESGGVLFGLVTDRDLRNRVLAAGLDPARPVVDIATLAPFTVRPDQTAFDALLLMARHNIHHIPVLDGQDVLGVLTAQDLAERHSTSAVFLTSEICQHTTLQGLKRSSQQIRHLQRNLAAAGASAYSTGQMVTAVTDALTRRLLELGEQMLGPAPIPYVWVAAGSQGRCEQTARSDQDNCLMLDARYSEAEHGEYFGALARWTCDGLNACGYVYCPGDVMATNPDWCQPLPRWHAYFGQWTQQPDPKALMLTSVFFDLRAVHGQADLLDSLRADVLAHTRGNTIFLAHMVGNALHNRPPLGLFQQLAPIGRGEHKGKLDLKHSGAVPVVDLARVYALAGGHAAVNTHDRLLAAAAGGAISAASAHDLRDALEFMASLRLAHQARQLDEGTPPDNHLDLGEISNFERTQLRDAFAVVQKLQQVLAQRYQAGRF
jgi:CBS domain-containing protein